MSLWPKLKLYHALSFNSRDCGKMKARLRCFRGELKDTRITSNIRVNIADNWENIINAVYNYNESSVVKRKTLDITAQIL